MAGDIYPTLTSAIKAIQSKVEAGKKLTELQQAALDKYELALNSPELPKGVKTYLEGWHKEQEYKRRKEFKSKYTDKGNAVEDDAIDFIGEALGFGFLMKNEEHFGNGFIQGTPDVIFNDLVIDNKSSWDCFTFPLYEDSISSDYWWQAQGYMILTGRSKYLLAYTLMDLTDEDALMREAWNAARAAGLDEVDEDLYLSVKAKHTYSDLPDHKRIKAYFFNKAEEAESQITERVKLARLYIDSLKYNNIIEYSKGEIVKRSSLQVENDKA